MLASVLEWPSPAGLVASVVTACERLATARGPYADACAAAVRVAADHPGDVGVVAMLLMRHAVLQPGQAVFMPAGGLHAYLRGTGIELLANSDNVVRSGLTGKHIDVPELLKLLDPAVAVPVLSPRVLPDGIAWFDTPAPEFRLYVVDLTGPALALPVPARHLRPARRRRPDARAHPGRFLLPVRCRRPGPRHRPRPPGPGHARRAPGRIFMIVASSGQIAPISGHDHGPLTRLPGARRRVRVTVSLLSAVGACVEALRSAIPR